jgi:hypothetical protein
LADCPRRRLRVLGEIIQNLGQPQERERSDADEIAEAVLRKLSRSGHAV